MKGELWEVIIRNALIAAEQWKRGSIPPGRYSLKWKSDYENRSSLNYMFNFDKKDVKLSSVWGEICCIAYLCRVCRKIIIDV